MVLKRVASENDIAIIGMAGRFPKANTLEEYWNNIIHQVDATTFFSDEELERIGIDERIFNQPNYIKAKPYIEEADCFDASFFGFSHKEAKYLDPQIRLFLEVAYHALEDGAYNPELCTNQVGVFAGASTSLEWYRLLFQQHQETTLSESFEAWILSCKDFLSQIVSYRLNLTGPSYTIYTACSTSLATVHLACQSLLMGECEMALAGGVTIDLPLRGGYMHETGMIHSPSGTCRPFDDAANGTVFGDGVGAIVLKKLNKAIKDRNHIYAVIKGSRCNNDGRRKMGFIAPSLEGQSEVLKMTYQVSHSSAESIDYIETHGTGTKVGDPIEFEGLKIAHANRTSPCALGSVKANIGHLHAAAGIAGLIKVVLALNYRTIPPLTHFASPNQELRLKDSSFYFPRQAIEWKKTSSSLRRAAVSSLGVGGTNVHVIVEEPSQVPTKRLVKSNGSRTFIFPLSAKSPQALEKMTERFLDFIAKHPESDLPSIAYTLQLGRESFAHRTILIGDSKESLLRLKQERVPVNSEGCCERPFTLFCSTNGEVNLSLFKKRLKCPELFHFNQTWQKVLDKCLPEHIKIGIFAALEGKSEAESEVTVARFLYHLQQVNYIISFGLEPHVYLGDSQGAYIAAICTKPDAWEDILISYLHTIYPTWINEDKMKLDEIQRLISRHLSCHSFDPHVCLLVYGDYSRLAGISSCRCQIAHSIAASSEVESTQLIKLIAHLWQNGVNVRWQKFNKDQEASFIPLPSYPFEKQKHWFENKMSAKASLEQTSFLQEKNLMTHNDYSSEFIVSVIKNTFLEVLQVDSLESSDNFYRKGGDSLQLIQIVSKINKEFKVELDLEEVFKVPTITKVVELLMQKIATQV